MPTPRGTKAKFLMQMASPSRTTILAFSQWNSDAQSMEEYQGLVNRTGERALFRLPGRIELGAGLVLQVKGSRDLWRAYDVCDVVEQGQFIYCEIATTKINGKGEEIRPTVEGTAVFHGPVFGAQIGVSGSSQLVTHNAIVPSQDLAEVIHAVRQLVSESQLTLLDKEDVIEALESLGRLSNHQKEPGILDRATKRVEQIRTIASASSELSLAIAPYIPALLQYFST